MKARSGHLGQRRRVINLGGEVVDEQWLTREETWWTRLPKSSLVVVEEVRWYSGDFLLLL